MNHMPSESETIIAARMQTASRLAAAVLQACPPTEPGAESLQERTFHEAMRLYRMFYQALQPEKEQPVR